MDVHQLLVECLPAVRAHFLRYPDKPCVLRLNNEPVGQIHPPGRLRLRYSHSEQRWKLRPWRTRPMEGGRNFYEA
jgi:hypothetical protein